MVPLDDQAHSTVHLLIQSNVLPITGFARHTIDCMPDEALNYQVNCWCARSSKGTILYYLLSMPNNFLNKSVSYSEYVLTDYIFLTWCAVMLYSGIVYLLYLDKDECATGEHDCQQICFNTPGSYMCLCDTGYQLGTDGHTCEGLLCSSLSHMYKHPI